MLATVTLIRPCYIFFTLKNVIYIFAHTCDRLSLRLSSNPHHTVGGPFTLLNNLPLLLQQLSSNNRNINIVKNPLKNDLLQSQKAITYEEKPNVYDRMLLSFRD